MAGPIQEYIKQGLKHRKNWKEMRAKLIAAGHEPAAVDDVYDDMMNYRRTKRRVYGIAILLIILIATVVSYSMFFSDANPEVEITEEVLSDTDYLDIAIGNNDRAQCENIKEEQLRSDCLILVK